MCNSFVHILNKMEKIMITHIHTHGLFYSGFCAPGLSRSRQALATILYVLAVCQRFWNWHIVKNQNHVTSILLCIPFLLLIIYCRRDNSLSVHKSFKKLVMFFYKFFSVLTSRTCIYYFCLFNNILIAYVQYTK